MKIIYSYHAERRLGQKGLIKLEIEHVLTYLKYIIKTRENRKIAIGNVKNRTVKVIFKEKKNYIKIITIR